MLSNIQKKHNSEAKPLHFWDVMFSTLQNNEKKTEPDYFLKILSFRAKNTLFLMKFSAKNYYDKLMFHEFHSF